MLQKTDADGYVKDVENNVVINNSTSEYQMYMLQRNRALQMKNVQEDINKLKEEMKIIQQAIQVIAARLDV